MKTIKFPHRDTSDMNNWWTPAEPRTLKDNFNETQLMPINSLCPCLRTLKKKKWSLLCM